MKGAPQRQEGAKLAYEKYVLGGTVFSRVQRSKRQPCLDSVTSSELSTGAQTLALSAPQFQSSGTFSVSGSAVRQFSNGQVRCIVDKGLIFMALGSISPQISPYLVTGFEDSVKAGVAPVPRPPASCSQGYYALMSINN